ncbi:hypothetical protein [Telluribacter sp.]|jgi:hypothetical protein|uniref:hypothetical protein n=1 Tax=Telluribacter sp. TaxID=1978767 RepID=UPI002E107A0B|nr:hypothetical protein [Telluribacter sp.]
MYPTILFVRQVKAVEVRKLSGLLTFILSLAISHSWAFGQTLSNANYYISLTQQPIILVYATAVDYENPKVVDKAIRVVTRAKKSNYSLYARIEPNGGTGLSQIPPNLFFLQVDNTIPAKNVPLTPFYLSNADQLLFREYDTADKEDIYEFDFGVATLGYSYNPGLYNYLITITLMAP